MDAPPTDLELHSLLGPPPQLVAADIHRIEDSVRSGATPRINNPRPPADVSVALAIARHGTPTNQGQGQYPPPFPPAPPMGGNSYSMGAMPAGVSWRYVGVLSHRASILEHKE